MKVVIFNVGAALSTHIETDNKKIVIDIGKNSDFSPVNDFLLPLFKKRGEKISVFFLGVCHDDVNRYGIFYYVVDS